MDPEITWLVTSSSYQYVVSYRDGTRIPKYVARDCKTINIDGMIPSHRKLVVGLNQVQQPQPQPHSERSLMIEEVD